MQNEVVSVKEDEHQVRFQGRMTAPKFTSKGSALAYLIAIASGKREPEFVIGQK
jgi:hypothetical protein